MPTTEVTTAETTPMPTTEVTTAVTTPMPTTEVTTAVTTPMPTTEVTTAETTPMPTTEVTTAVTTPMPTTEVTTVVTTPMPTTEVTTAVTTPMPTTEVTTAETTPMPTTEVTTAVTTPIATTEVNPTTISVQCPVLTAPTNGSLSPTGESTYLDVVTFSCDQGYELDGSTSATCQGDGSWNASVPDCNAVQCPARAAPANGAVSPTGAVSYPNSVTFTCNQGYVLNGTADTTCQTDGTWSNPVPTCPPVQCPTRAAPANGAVSPTGAVSYPNGVTFTCNPGYTLNGAATPTCQADGTWSNPVPTCTPVQCPARAAPANGAVSPTGAVSYPNSVTFTCNQGYVLNGTADTTCQTDGTWSNPVPTCTPVQCPARAAPANGAVSPTGAVPYPNSVTFTCNSGYTLNGVPRPTCQADGTWSHPVPTCTPVQCPARAAPANGAVSPTGAVSYPNGVTFTCNPGYVLTGVATTTCQADGTWSHPVPTCTPIQCPARAAPANGAVSPTGAVSYPNSVTFTCNPGYTLNGVATQTCQADTTWSYPVPTCQVTSTLECRPWHIVFQGKCKALQRFYVHLVYNASYDYEPDKHAPSGVQYEQSRREHLRHLNYMVDSITEITRFGTPGFRRFERGSLVSFQSLTLVEGDTPLSPVMLENHLQTYINDSQQNTSFPFVGATVTVTDLDECVEDIHKCPHGSTCVNTPGGYGCTYCSPEVTITGGGMSIPRSRAFRLNGRVSVGANCTEQFDTTYRWEASPPTGRHIVNTKADLLVPSKTLSYGTYLFRLTVTVNETDTGVLVSRTSNSASVSITASSLVAGILGGFRRQVGTGRVTLDAATLSSDPDGVHDLNFRWSCNSTTDGVCPVLNVPSGGDEGELTVNLGLETLHKELTFTVEVSAPGRDAVSASQIVEVVRSTIPLTSIICDTIYGTCGPKINSGEKMRLSVECSNCLTGPNAYTYHWTLVQRIQGSVTTWTDQDWNRNILNDRNQDYISFRAGVFNRQGSYTVTARVTDTNSSESGSSDYSFTLNEPPTVGNCTVHASNTSQGFFEIQCRDFNDNDLPLRYDFEYTAADVTVASLNSTVGSTYQHLLYSGPASSTPPIRLPTGNPDRNFDLEIFIRVTDVFGAFSNTSVTAQVRQPEAVEEFVETVLDKLDVDDLQQTTSSIASAASVLNIANGTDVKNTTRIEARERMVDILGRVEVQDLQDVKQVTGTLEHVINKPEELSDESQVKAADTLIKLEKVLTNQSSEVGTEELEIIAAHLVTGAVNVLEASSESAGRKREETRTPNFKKNEQATTTAFEAIDNLASTVIGRKFRDEKPTLVQAKQFLMSLANSSCEGLGLIQTSEETKAFFQIPENTPTKLCVNGTVGSQTYFTPLNPFEYANNSRDVSTAVLGLSVLSDERRKVLVRNLEEDERIESINPVQNTAPPVNGTAMSSSSGQLTGFRFNTSEPGVAFYVRVTPDVTGDDVNVTLRAYLKRGTEVSPGDYSHNATLTRTGYTTDGRTVTGMQPFTWFLNQSTLNISDEQETWAIGIQRVPTVDENGRLSDSAVRYNASIIPYKCLFFNETTAMWTDNGCEVGPKTTDEQLHCICDHLTAFAGFVAPNPLDLGSTFTFDLDRSVIALVTVCVVMALYIVAVFIGRSADLADERKRQRKARKELSKTTKGKGYLSHHLWLSVVKFPSGHFTRVQRISCCLSLLMSFMLVNIMFYRGDRDLLSKITIGDVNLTLPFSLTSFIIGLESSLIALPINVFIVVLFRYSGTRKKPSTPVDASKLKNKQSYGVPHKGPYGAELVLPRYLPKVEDVESEFDAEYTADPTAYIEKLKKDGALKKVDTRYVIKKEGSKITVNQKPYRPFPWWCRIVAWVLVAAIVVVSGAFTVLYGNEYGRAKSQSWLFAFLVSFLTDVIILQPIKIILVIIFFKLVTKKTKVTPETISVIQSRMDVMEETIWERRRKKLLKSYQDRYVRQPALMRKYINTGNRSVSNYSASDGHFGHEDSSYPDQYLVSRRSSLNSSERSLTDVVFTRDFGDRDLYQRRYVSPRYSLSQRTDSDELSDDHHQNLSPLPSYIKRAWSPSNDEDSTHAHRDSHIFR
ncbi:polycystin family receptor for egg jelly-like isoform X3 [Branchiostoma floridae x Branchiostoma belcheri]